MKDQAQIALMYVCADGAGVPMRQEELAGRKGKGPDGSAKTREAKLGGVFLQTEVDQEGHPVRQEDSTTYIESFEGAAEFGLLLRQEAQRRSLAQATLLLLFIGSGVVEAGCRTVIGKRMKCSGMFWSEQGGQGILDLRCGFLSNRLDTFCQTRAINHAAQNDPLKLAA